jgi:hypothetical protein
MPSTPQKERSKSLISNKPILKISSKNTEKTSRGSNSSAQLAKSNSNTRTDNSSKTSHLKKGLSSAEKHEAVLVKGFNHIDEKIDEEDKKSDSSD